MVLLRHITASSPAYAVHYHSAVYTMEGVPCNLVLLAASDQAR